MLEITVKTYKKYFWYKFVKSNIAVWRSPFTYAIGKSVFISQKQESCMQESAFYKRATLDVSLQAFLWVKTGIPARVR